MTTRTDVLAEIPTLPRGEKSEVTADVAMPDLSAIETDGDRIVQEIGHEAVDVYSFLCNEFNRGPVTGNHVFQFAYRYFYRLDTAGLTPEFMSAYFLLLERSRTQAEVDLRRLVRDLHSIRNRKGQQTLQFSFVTKLAHTVNHRYPIYATEIERVFGFRRLDSGKPFDDRLEKFMGFYDRLSAIYTRILTGHLLEGPRRAFRQTYAASPEKVPETKVLDFIFWRAGKLSLRAG